MAVSPILMIPALLLVLPGALLGVPNAPTAAEGAGNAPPALVQIIRAADWKGAVQVGDEGCNASMGEYSLWVYARATQCGVAPDQADRVVVIRQPLPGVAPIRAALTLPGGRYVVWVYGAGQPGHPWLRLCAKICVLGELPATPGWVSLGPIETRDNQLLLLRSWQQPEGHRLEVQAVVLSADDAKPDWIP
ncbi:hypothetical protein [Candidatus Nitrospira bockiana]